MFFLRVLMVQLRFFVVVSLFDRTACVENESKTNLWLPVGLHDVDISADGFDPVLRWCRMNITAWHLRPELTPKFTPKVEHVYSTGVCSDWRLSTIEAGETPLPPPLGVGGFVVHHARCGSTVVSNMLTSHPMTLVYAEHMLPSDIIKRCENCSESRMVDLLRRVLVCMTRTNAHRHVVFKMKSPLALHLHLFRAALPTTPWVFVFRPIVSTLRSLLSQKSRGTESMRRNWNNSSMYSNCLTHNGTNTRDLDNMSGEERASRCAHFLSGLFRMPLQQWLEDRSASLSRGLFVHYDSLAGSVVDEVLPHFGINTSLAEQEVMVRVASTYAKGNVEQSISSDPSKAAAEVAKFEAEHLREGDKDIQFAVRYLEPFYDAALAIKHLQQGLPRGQPSKQAASEPPAQCTLQCLLRNERWEKLRLALAAAGMGAAAEAVSHVAAREQCLGDEAVKAFQLQGWFVARGAVSAEWVEALSGELAPNWQAFPWMTNDIVRDFLYEGPLATLSSRLLGGGVVRLVWDQSFVVKAGSQQEARGWHTDRNGGRIFGVLMPSSPALQAWLPLQDIDPEVDGGTLLVAAGTHLDEPCYSNCSAQVAAAQARGDIVKPSLRKGDVLFIDQRIVHATQALLAGRQRAAYVARFTNEFGQWAGPQHKYCPTCCFGEEVAGMPLRSPCFPQLYPAQLQNETEARSTAGRLQGEPASVLSQWALQWVRGSRANNVMTSVIANSFGFHECAGSVRYCSAKPPNH